MFSTLWFLIKSVCLIAVFALVVTMGGMVSIVIGPYSLSMTVGLFILCLFISVWLLLLIARALHALVTAPAALGRYNRKKAQKKGLQSLAYGLSAIAAGDVKAASHYTKNVVKYLKREDFGLSDLMEGLTARLKGDHVQMQRSFHSMMLHKETSFLGVKGLLQTAIDKKDYRYALILAEKAYAKHPDQAWIIRTLYELQLKTRHYEAALDTLKKAEKRKAINKSEAGHHKAALLLGQGEVAKAYKVAPISLPVGLAILDQWATENKRRKSIALIKRLWGENPHPDLMDYWIRYAPKKAVENTPIMISWIEDLYNQNADDASSALYTGESLLNIGQKDHAKRFIKQAVTQKTTVLACRLMYQVETDRYWIDQLATALPDKTWVCTKTGETFKDWTLQTDNGFVDCLVWGYPDAVKINPVFAPSGFLIAA